MKEEYPIDGVLYTVNPIAINQPVDVYTKNKRCICVVESESFGTILLCIIAATMVIS